MQAYVEHGLNVWHFKAGYNGWRKEVEDKLKNFGGNDIAIQLDYNADLRELLEKHLTECNLQLSKETRIPLGSVALYAKKADIVKDAFVEKFYDSIDGSAADLEFRCYTTTEMDGEMDNWVNYSTYLWTSPDTLNIWGHYNWAGFHYFSSHDARSGTPDTVKYLIAYLNGMPVGVIKFGVWPYTPDHTGIAYIDVHEKMKRKGIATAMVKELNKHLDTRLPLYLTDESEEGREAGMAHLFKREITAVECLSYEDQLAAIAK